MLRHHYHTVILLFIMITLSSCATIQANYYTQTINSWRGANISTLIETWGKPEKKLTTLSGSTMYVYKKQENRRANHSTTPSVGVNYHPGGTPIMTTHKTNWNNGMTLFCIVAFEVNSQGIVMNAQTQGNNCFADAAFMRQMSRNDS